LLSLDARVALVACGALAGPIAAIATRRGWPVDVHPLPALLHNRPERIAAAVESAVGDLRASGYAQVAVGFADCGTYGALDGVCERLGVARLVGAHCYDVFAGAARMRAMFDTEPGTYVLTDFLVQTFRRTVVVELGLDRHPERPLPPRRLARPAADASAAGRRRGRRRRARPAAGDGRRRRRRTGAPTGVDARRVSIHSGAANLVMGVPSGSGATAALGQDRVHVTMAGVTSLQLAHTADLDAATLAKARALLDEVFDGDMTPEDWEHALGGVHAIVWDGADVIGHASVVQRRLLHGGRALRTGYVEGVGVRADQRRQGHFATVMTAVERVIRNAYDLGALGTTDVAAKLYAARGWQVWQGSLYALTPTGIVSTAEESGGIYALPVSVPLDLGGDLICDWRSGDVW
jgi:aminoglycoside 2'-N-acetyltransferase I